MEQCRIADTQFYYEGEQHTAGIYDRPKLRTGQVVPGPAIVCEMDSTTLVLPGCRAEVDAVGNLLLNKAA